jgi:XRE family aerobic/anaerobic benzoate catabolism transcriptional regulator
MAPGTDQTLLLDLGKSIQSRRKERSWSRRELAHLTGLSERFLADIERGTANPSILRLAQIARALETTPPDLLRPATTRTRKNTIALLGLRGAGKSTIGAGLAARLHCEVIELDARIEEAVGLSLAEIFELHGEDYFRRAERDVLKEVLESSAPQVIATGGGLVQEPQTFALLRQSAHTVWLKARPEDHWTRVVAQGDLRPMEGNERAFAHLCGILAEREKLYQQADVTVDTSSRGLEDVTDELAERFQSRLSAESPQV